MSKILEDYLRDVRRHLKQLPIRERDAVLAEIRDHLQSEARRLCAADKRLSGDEAMLQATNAFGDPQELGIAYGPQGGVVRRSTGEQLLDVAVLTSRAAGRGVKGVLKWTGIAAAVLLGAALIALIATLVFAGEIINTFEDDIREAVPHPIYHFSDDRELTDPRSGVTQESFQVADDFREFKFFLETDPEAGCVQVQLTSPSGEANDVTAGSCDAVSRSTTYTEHGTWTVRYLFAAYAGSIDVNAVGFKSARSGNSSQGAAGATATPGAVPQAGWPADPPEAPGSSGAGPAAQAEARTQPSCRPAALPEAVPSGARDGMDTDCPLCNEPVCRHPLLGSAAA